MEKAKKPEIPDFIEVHDNIISSKDCIALILNFENIQENNLGLVINRQDKENAALDQKQDHVASVNEQCLLSNFDGGLIENLYTAINEKITEYCDKYPGMFADAAYKTHTGQYPATLAGEGANFQKTAAGEGYHVWHCEAGCNQSGGRALSWLVYLNDFEDDQGGETEFISYHKRIKPKSARLVIHPAGFTHVHRGNPPLYGDKYIITGWVRYIS